ncbi:hypothetical protein JCM33374_g1256 [Metschnikowia sp. JCM 33374]|nr:hypothetical protein JCM33374_g1256 [Metschnikowia sp. JCM 33374]
MRSDGPLFTTMLMLSLTISVSLSAYSNGHSIEQTESDPHLTSPLVTSFPQEKEQHPKPKKTETEVRNTNLDLSWLIADLKTFVNETNIDSARFLSHAPYIAKRLVVLGHRFNQYNSSKSLNAYNFARHRFRAMESSSHLLQSYTSDDTDQCLLRWVVNLNVRLLAFFDDNGLPNTKIPDYWSKILGIFSLLGYWHRVFSLLERKQYHVIVCFENQMKKAESTLWILAQATPNGG